MSIKALHYNVEDLGKYMKSSKKKFLWVFAIDNKEHTLELEFSFLSGKKKVIQDGRTLLLNTSFQYPFTLDGHSVNIIQQGETFELRIDNKVFAHLYTNQRTKSEFVWEDEPKPKSDDEPPWNSENIVNSSTLNTTGQQGQKKIVLNLNIQKNIDEQSKQQTNTNQFSNFKFGQSFDVKPQQQQQPNINDQGNDFMNFNNNNNSNKQNDFSNFSFDSFSFNSNNQKQTQPVKDFSSFGFATGSNQLQQQQQQKKPETQQTTQQIPLKSQNNQQQEIDLLGMDDPIPVPVQQTQSQPSVQTDSQPQQPNISQLTEQKQTSQPNINNQQPATQSTTQNNNTISWEDPFSQLNQSTQPQKQETPNIMNLYQNQAKPQIGFQYMNPVQYQLLLQQQQQLQMMNPQQFSMMNQQQQQMYIMQQQQLQQMVLLAQSQNQQMQQSTNQQINQQSSQANQPPKANPFDMF